MVTSGADFLVCSTSLTTPVSATRVRSRLAEALNCNPFLVSISMLTRTANIVSCYARISGPVSEPPLSLSDAGIYCRQITSRWGPIDRALALHHFHGAAAKMCWGADSHRRRRIFLGRPLVIAAEQFCDTVEVVHFSLRDWEAFRFSSAKSRQHSYELFLFAQSAITGLARAAGWRTTIRQGRGVELVLGDPAVAQ